VFLASITRSIITPLTSTSVPGFCRALVPVDEARGRTTEVLLVASKSVSRHLSMVYGYDSVLATLKMQDRNMQNRKMKDRGYTFIFIHRNGSKNKQIQ